MTPESKNKRLAVRVTDSLFERIRVQVFHLRVSTQDFVTDAIEKHLASFNGTVTVRNAFPKKKG